MKNLLSCLAFVLMIPTTGCAPKPVVDDGDARPAAEVIVTPESTRPPREAETDATGVDVQVGGGQGVQVEVERDPAAEQ